LHPKSFVELQVTSYSQELQLFYGVVFVIGAINRTECKRLHRISTAPNLLLVAFFALETCTCNPTQSLKDPTFAVELLI